MTLSIDDLDKAKADLANLEERDSMDTSGNPEKYHTRIQQARRHVREVEKALKAAGAIPYTDQERLEQQLDAAFPKARSKETVDFEGSRYRRQFKPLSKSRSGKTVTQWHPYWVKLADD
ncbi:hypothetical protein ACFP76_07610 [Paracoccus aerius]|nr:hypothetical protein GCM10017322_28450 [Paracoccus aerius]